MPTSTLTATDDLDSVQILDADGELEGYALTADPAAIRRDTLPVSSAALITPVRCCRTCAWGDADHLVRSPGGVISFTGRVE